MEEPANDRGLTTRRSILKGIGLGALGVGAGGLLEGCGSLKGSSTTDGGTIVIGFVSPQTGALAGFASGDNFIVDRIRQTPAYAKGFQIGGKTYNVNIVVKDTQSDPTCRSHSGLSARRFRLRRWWHSLPRAPPSNRIPAEHPQRRA